MSNVSEILSYKGSRMHSVRPEATVVDAAILMNEHKCGSLVVMDEDELLGIFTERDILSRVVAKRRDPATTRVADVMTREVACCRIDTSIEEARSVMKNRRIRHLPVVDEAGRLYGMISIGDLNAHKLDGQEVTIHFLKEYMYGQA